MSDQIFILGMASFLAAVLAWGFRALPGEKWQILFSVPGAKDPSGAWSGTNYTYYGLFQANAMVLAILLLVTLVGSLRLEIPLGAVAMTAGILTAICLPSNKIVARIVEKKQHTTTVAGSYFVGTLVAPWALWLSNETTGFRLPLIPFLAAGYTAYALGESLGRLACISFGCCYGKPLHLTSRLVQDLFGKYSFVFSGATKKAAYESGLEGIPVVPVQAISSVFLAATALAGTYLYLNGFFGPAFLVTSIASQGWRFVSELLRSDYRGEGRISAYQVMSLVGIAYCFGTWLAAAGAPEIRPDVIAGLRTLWNPLLVVILQVAWVAIFLNYGRSRVTGSTIGFYVRRDHV